MTKVGADRLEEMSDGALRKAIQSLENAHGSVEYAIRMLPEGIHNDINDCNGAAVDAESRINEQLEMLYEEWNRRK